MAAPRYLQRLARLPGILARVAAHPDGVRIGDVAAEERIPVAELREDLLAYYTADSDQWMLGLYRPTVIEFLAPDGSDADPEEAEVVRVVDERGVGELGVEHLAAHELAFVYTAALALQEAEPDPDLDAALDVLAETMFGGPVDVPRPASYPGVLEPIREAIAGRRRLGIVYSRQWEPGVSERTVEPYALVQTRRGWEVDAGPPDHGLRTYLLSNIRSVAATDETFEPPRDLDRLLQEQRRRTTVRMMLRHDARWAADMYAETVDVVDEDDETFTADLALLPPVEGRVGLITLAGGEDTRVLSPAGLLAAGPSLAAELHAHHAGDGRA